METIYLDRLFIINLVIDYFLALCSARVCGVMLRRGRYALSALFGAVYASLSVFPSLGFLTAPVSKLIAGLLTALIAFGTEERFFRCAAVFFSVSALFGGAVWALSMQSGGNGLYIPMSMPLLILSFALVYAALSLVFCRSGKGFDRQTADIVIGYRGISLTLRALCDSGNALFDPITGASVMVCSAERLKDIFPHWELGAVELVSEYPGELRLIPYSAVGTESSMLAAFRPDKLTVSGKERDDILVAVSPEPIRGDGFDSIIGI